MRSRPAGAGLTSVLGVVIITVAAALVGLLHLVGPTAAVNPFRRTISEYALLETGWLFDAAVLAVAAGSAAVLVGLVRSGLVRPVSLASVALGLWTAGMAGVVLFPKHNWSVGPSVSGDIHRVASLAAFVSLPVAALALGMGWRRHPRWRVEARVTLGCGMASFAAFAPLLYAIVSAPFTGVSWWRAIPLGAVERVLALIEVVTLLAIGVWSAHAAFPPRASRRR